MMGTTLVTASVGEGPQVRVYPADDGTFWLKLTLRADRHDGDNETRGVRDERVSIGLHGFTQDALEHLTADVFNAVRDAIMEAQQNKREAKVDSLEPSNA